MGWRGAVGAGGGLVGADLVPDELELGDEGARFGRRGGVGVHRGDERADVAPLGGRAGEAVLCGPGVPGEEVGVSDRLDENLREGTDGKKGGAGGRCSSGAVALVRGCCGSLLGAAIVFGPCRLDSPLLYLPRPALTFLFRPRHHARHVPFHALFVEAIELQTLGGGGPRRAGAGDLLDGVQGVDEDAVWRSMIESALRI